MTSNELIKRIYADQSDIPFIDGLVIDNLSAGNWLIRDITGRNITAKSNDTWKINVDWVRIQAGKIISRAPSRGEIQTFEV